VVAAGAGAALCVALLLCRRCTRRRTVTTRRQSATTSEPLVGVAPSSAGSGSRGGRAAAGLRAVKGPPLPVEAELVCTPPGSPSAAAAGECSSHCPFSTAERKCWAG
jgi:hypothetical protein